MSDQTERSQSVSEEQKPSPEAYEDTGLGGERQDGGDADEAAQSGAQDTPAENDGPLSHPSETGDESTGDTLEGTTSEDIEDGDDEPPRPPDEGLPS